jgi:hypothetical protein
LRAFEDVAVGVGDVVRSPAAGDVLLEGVAGGVVAVGQQLDPEIAAGPVAVDLVAVVVDVRPRQRELVAAQERAEAGLEVAERDVRGERAAQLRRALLRRIASGARLDHG